MALNNLGLGLTFKATDQASPIMQGVANNLTKTAAAGEAAKKRLKELGEGFEKVGATSAVAGAALAGGLGLAVHEAAKFQFGVGQIVTEADKAKLPASEIARIAKEMATTYGGDLDTQIKALYQGVAAGADNAAKSMALLNGANRLAIAGNTTQETALLGITKVLNNYGLAFDRATDVADAFFVAVKGGQTTVGELGDAIGQVAALGKNAGISMEELIGALGTAATLGKDTASATASMKAALAGIAHPTAEAAAEAQKLGIKFDSTTLRSMGLVKFLNQITSSSKFSADTMNKLFGSVEAAGFMAALTANKGEALTAMMDGMSKKAGGAEEAFKTMSDTIKQAWSVLSANFQVALVDLGSTFLPVLTSGVKMITGLLKAFNSLPEPVKRGIAIFAALLAGVLLLAGAVAGLVGVFLTAEVPIMAVAAAFGITLQAMAPLIVVGGALVATVMAIRRAFDENVGGLRDTLLPLWKKAELTWRALSQAFSQGGFSGAVRDELNKGNEGIKSFVVNVYSWAQRIKNFLDGIGKGFESASNAAGPTFAKLSLAIERLVSAFGRLFGGKQDPQQAATAFDRFGSAGERVGATLEKIAEVVVSGLTAAIDFSSGFIETIQEWLPTFGRLWDAGKTLFGAFGELAGALMQLAAAFGIGGGAADQTGSRFAAFVGTLAEVIALGARVVAFIVGELSGAFRGLAIVVGFVRDIVVGTFRSIVSAIMETIGLIAKVLDKASGMFGGKETGLSKGLSDIGTKFGAGPNAFDPNKLFTPQGGAASTPAPVTSASAPVAKLVPLVPSAPEVTAAPTLASIAATGAAAGGAAGAAGRGPTAGEIGAATAQAIRQAPAPALPPINVVAMLDGEKVGEGMANRANANATRAYQPVPNPGG